MFNQNLSKKTLIIIAGILVASLLIGFIILFWLNLENEELTRISQISSSGWNTLAIKTDGSLWAWGNNNYGQLGTGDTVHRSSPVQVGTNTDWRQVVVGGVCNCVLAIKTDGTLWAWGNNRFGQLGLDDTINRLSPVQIGTDTNWKQVAIGALHILAIKTDGTLWTWGIYGFGEGYADIGLDWHISSPIQVGTDTNWKQVAAGQDRSLAIKNDGTLWFWGTKSAWGFGGYIGYIGWLEYIINKPEFNDSDWLLLSPVQIGTDANWEQITTSLNHVLAIKTDGTLWAWGNNAYGELGLGDTTAWTNFPPTLIQVGTDTNWKQIAAGFNHTLAIKTDSALWAWGNNKVGQLGLGIEGGDFLSPVQVETNINWQKVAAAGFSSFAIKTDGTLWAWGFNDLNQLGLGDAINRVSPVQVKVSKEKTMVLEEIILPKQEFKYPVRWTKYAKIDNLERINRLYDLSVDLLNPFIRKEGMDINIERKLELERLGDGVIGGNDIKLVRTCREYLCAKEQGFGTTIRMHANFETFYFTKPCLYLQFFKETKGSKTSHLDNFSLKENWLDLPIEDIFDIGGKTSIIDNVYEVIDSEIKQADEIHIAGINSDIIHRPFPDWVGHPFTFSFYLMGWGDWNNDSIEDVLLYTDIADALWGYDNFMPIIISRLSEDGPIIRISQIIDKLNEPSPSLCK